MKRKIKVEKIFGQLSLKDQAMVFSMWEHLEVNFRKAIQSVHNKEHSHFKNVVTFRMVVWYLVIAEHYP
jgi:hypothetical protein